jgi:hypothetical protein
MSYDLMVFRKEAAPKTRTDFMLWYDNQTQWAEKHSYDDPANTSIALREWFMEMIKTFPAMNGPFASEDYDDPKVSEYCIGKDVIYVEFPWSVSEQACNKMLELAEKHGVGFFDVSSNNGVILFPVNGKLITIEDLGAEGENLETDNALIRPVNRPWWKFW